MKHFRWIAFVLFCLCVTSPCFDAAEARPARVKTEAADLRRRLGQMLMVGFRGLAVKERDPIARDIREHHLGGVVLFDRDVALKSDQRNIQSPEQVRRLVRSLQDQARTPLLVAIDQEGGQVARLKTSRGFPATSEAKLLGDFDHTGVSRAAGEEIGATLAALGINLDLAPVVDLNINPKNPAIGAKGRSFGADPKRVVLQAGAFADGLRSRGVLSCLKHFPGHGSAWNDSHLGMTDITETWRKEELIPYRALAGEGRCDAVMTGHLFHARLDPQHPATLSQKILGGLLREEMGWQGVIISDDMQMKAIADEYGLEQALVLAVNAGVDILLFGNNLSYDPDIVPKAVGLLEAAVKDGRIPRARIVEASDRVAALKKRLLRRTP